MFIFEDSNMHMKQTIKVANWIGIVVFLVLQSGCQTQYPVNIPVVDVDITINIFDYPDLQGVGGSAYIDGGSRGIIVYRVSIEQFNAYERHCTYDSENPCGKVSKDVDGLFLVDDDCFGTGCGSRFNIINGSNVDGPSQYPLIQYNASYDGGALVHVFN